MFEINDFYCANQISRKSMTRKSVKEINTFPKLLKFNKNSQAFTKLMLLFLVHHIV